MLAEDIHEQSAASLIESLPCRVRLPEKLKETFELTGASPSAPDDQRRFSRVRCRSAGHRAGLLHSATFPSLERDEAWHAVYLADFSKGGVQFIHCDQLYPGERCHLLLLTGNLLELEAIRCKRLGSDCYSIGAQIVKSEV